MGYRASAYHYRIKKISLTAVNKSDLSHYQPWALNPSSRSSSHSPCPSPGMRTPEVQTWILFALWGKGGKYSFWHALNVPLNEILMKNGIWIEMVMLNSDICSNPRTTIFLPTYIFQEDSRQGMVFMFPQQAWNLNRYLCLLSIPASRQRQIDLGVFLFFSLNTSPNEEMLELVVNLPGMEQSAGLFFSRILRAEDWGK